MRKWMKSTVVVVALALSGCANVKVMKVQVNAGEKEPEGIPFFLPRPYVQVYEPFVISSKVRLVEGQVTPDGQFLVIDNVKGDLDGVLAANLAGRVPIQFPTASVRVVVPQDLSGGAQSGNDASTSGALDGASTSGKKDEPKTAAPVGAPSEPVSLFSTSVTQSPTPFTSTLGRRFFDVVWMPDFDEKYVVQGRPGLGNSNIGVTMVQGWGLYGLDARIDNSAVVKPLLDFYSTGLDALSKLAKSKILPASAVTGGVQSGAVDGAARSRATALMPGARVSVKVTKVTVAAPGLYPILKPREVAGATDSNSGTVFVPLRPYTNVAFNTYDVLVVEAAKPSGDSPMNLQRYFESTAQGSTASTPPIGTGGATVNSTDLSARLNGILKAEKSADNAVWVISDVKMEGTKLKATATLTGGSQKPTKYATTNSLKQLLSLQSGVAVGDIELTEK